MLANIVLGNNLHSILLIQHSKESNKWISVVLSNNPVWWKGIILLYIIMNNNLQAILSIQFDIFKHEEKEWNKIILEI